MPRFSTFLISLFSALCFAFPALSQVYPTPQGPGVNDYANMLDPDSEARINATLADLQTRKNVQITVVTLSSVRFYANNVSVPDYATSLFNTWGIGNAEKGDGILFLIFRDDRELRIELGSGYDAAQKETVARIVGETVMPAFMEGKFPKGIETGVADLITRVADPAPVPSVATVPASSDPAPATGGNGLYWLIGIIGVPILALVAVSRRRAAKLAKTPCPSCGKTGTLTQTRVTMTEASLTADGKGETRTTCAACGNVTALPFVIPRLRPEEKAAPFKGGRSKGDGASGKW